jgi:tripartite-type tricarboxylate transporter receptor subunit TctC
VGHDGARVQSSARDAKLDDGIEVFNVDGAGGTLGLSQLVSRASGDPYQLMMTGLVMRLRGGDGGPGAFGGAEE